MDLKLNKLLLYFNILENNDQKTFNDKFNVWYDFIIKNNIILNFEINLKKIKNSIEVSTQKYENKLMKLKNSFKKFNLKIKNMKIKNQKFQYKIKTLESKHKNLLLKNSQMEKKYTEIIKSTIKTEPMIDIQDKPIIDENKNVQLMEFDMPIKKNKIVKVNPLNKYKYLSILYKIFNKNIFNLNNKISYEEFFIFITSFIEDFIKLKKSGYEDKTYFLEYIANSLEFFLKLIIFNDNFIYFNNFQNDVNPIVLFPVKYSVKKVNIRNIESNKQNKLLTCPDSLLLLEKEFLLIFESSMEYLNNLNESKTPELEDKLPKKVNVKKIHKRLINDFILTFCNLKIYLLSKIIINIINDLSIDNIENNKKNLKDFDIGKFNLDDYNLNYKNWVKSLFN